MALARARNNLLLARSAPLRSRPDAQPAVHCATCRWRTLCLPLGLEPSEIAEFDRLIGDRRAVRKEQPLYLAGSEFHALYAIRSGIVTTTIVAEDGREQVAGYHIPGEIVGADGIASGRHVCSAVATAETEVCAIPFDRLESLARDIPALQRSVYRLLVREIGGIHERLLMLGSMDAQERLAWFLLELSERHRRRGQPTSELRLHLSREQLASHLGVRLETVSRAFTRLQAAGILQVQGRSVKLLDPPSLRRLLGRDGHAPGE